MPYALVNEIDLYFEEHGNPRGAPLVLIHGFGGCGTTWQGHIPAFASDYRIIVPDLRGHCRSSGAPETIHHRYFAADLIGLLDYLQIDRAHFVGQSSGGMCLLFVGLESPQRARTLTLSSATYTFDAHARRIMLQNVERMHTDPEARAQRIQVHGPYKGEDYWRVLTEVFRQFTVDPENELPSRPEKLAAISRPVLVLHGDRDQFFPVNIPTTLYRSLPNAELCILPNTTHALPRENPSLFVRIVSDFLARHADA
jgi:pimeloyl-ACP methyl ester carboxylesterase